MPFNQIILSRRAHAGPVEHSIARKSWDMVATERIEWLGEASRRKVLLDDGHVIQVQVNSEKYQGTLVFVRRTNHDAG